MFKLLIKEIDIKVFIGSVLRDWKDNFRCVFLILVEYMDISEI